MDYFVLCARVLLAWIFLSYGWSKLNNAQFGLSPEEIAKPVSELGLFKLSWFLFDQQPFKTFVGISQILAGLLLLFNRTLILGALISIPILLNILIIDITYIKMTGFYWRLSYYLFLDLIILWHYRERLKIAFDAVYKNLSPKFKYPLWAYLLLPIMAIGLEILGVVPRIITGLVLNTNETIEGIGKTFEIFSKIISKSFS